MPTYASSPSHNTPIWGSASNTAIHHSEFPALRTSGNSSAVAHMSLKRTLIGFYLPCRVSYAVLCLTFLAVSAVHCQQSPQGAPAGDDVLARVSGPARAPTNSVSTNLVPVPEGTVYYGDATEDNLYEGKWLTATPPLPPLPRLPA